VSVVHCQQEQSFHKREYYIMNNYQHLYTALVEHLSRVIDATDSSVVYSVGFLLLAHYWKEIQSVLRWVISSPYSCTRNVTSGTDPSRRWNLFALFFGDGYSTRNTRSSVRFFFNPDVAIKTTDHNDVHYDDDDDDTAGCSKTSPRAAPLAEILVLDHSDRSLEDTASSRTSTKNKHPPATARGHRRRISREAAVDELFLHAPLSSFTTTTTAAADAFASASGQQLPPLSKRHRRVSSLQNPDTLAVAADVSLRLKRKMMTTKRQESDSNLLRRHSDEQSDLKPTLYHHRHPLK
jgi:hypothetical protein